MKIFITGGTGFIGSHVVRQATNCGHEVTALRRPGSIARIPLQIEPQWIEGLLTDNWRSQLSKCDAFIHLAAYGVCKGANDWEGCFRVNVMDSINLWNQAADAGIKKFVVVGSCFEYGLSGENYDRIPVTSTLEPTTAYGSSKASATMAAIAFSIERNLRLVIARPFHVYGPGEEEARFWPSLVAAAQSGVNFRMTAGAQVRNFQPVEQTALELIKLLDMKNILPGRPKYLNLGSHKSMTLLEFAQGEWERLNAAGLLIPGSIPYRKNEVMKYIPELNHI